MRKYPITTPELSHKGVTIFERHLPLRGLADMGNNIFRFDRIPFDQLGYRRGNRRCMVNKVPDPSPLKKSNAPAVFVFVGEAASRGKTGKAEHNVGRYIAVHAEQLAHDGQTE